MQPPNRKALIQITERCPLHCAHCFVSAGSYGDDITVEAISGTVLPKLRQCRVVSLTLTGGEPFSHPDLIGIVQIARQANFRVGICTSGIGVTEHQVARLKEIGGVHVNVSLDGFRAETHGRFRGDVSSFSATIKSIIAFGAAGLLQGILVTPNNLADEREYSELSEFASQHGAEYVLLNPLSSVGRGVGSKTALGSSQNMMRNIQKRLEAAHSDIERVYIRFPNDALPLAPCIAGDIIYVFARGDVTVCPYLVFAAKTPKSKHSPAEFIVGNIFKDADIATRLDAYQFHKRFRVGANSTCSQCEMNSSCGKGCPAMVIASGSKIGEVDYEVCPIVEEVPGGFSAAGNLYHIRGT